MEKLYNSHIISKLAAIIPLTIIALLMHNFITNEVRILRICKDFAGNRVNELGNVPLCEIIPKFSDLKVVGLYIIAEAFGFDSENLLFYRLHHECNKDLPNLINRRQFNARGKLMARHVKVIRRDVDVDIDGSKDVFGIDSIPVKICKNARTKRCASGRDNIEAASDWGYCTSQGIYYYGYKLHAVYGGRGLIHSFGMTTASIQYHNDVLWEYHDCMIEDNLNAEVQEILFEANRITLKVPYRMNQKNWLPSILAYKMFRKRIETIFSQLNDNLMIIRNYAKQACGLFSSLTSKIATMTFLQYVKFVNQRPIGQIKYSLI